MRLAKGVSRRSPPGRHWPELAEGASAGLLACAVCGDAPGFSALLGADAIVGAKAGHPKPAHGPSAHPARLKIAPNATNTKPAFFIGIPFANGSALKTRHSRVRILT